MIVCDKCVCDTLFDNDSSESSDTPRKGSLFCFCVKSLLRNNYKRN